MKISLVTLPYNAAGRGKGGASGPDALVRSGLLAEIQAQGHQVQVAGVQLSPAEELAYGGWNRHAVVNGYLADLVANASLKGDVVLGLLSDCNGVLGMLGGLQRSDHPAWPRRVGLVWIDAHGDYNTPETSPSGMLGGMPVAVAAGKALTRLRQASKIAVPLQRPDIIMAGLRDLDPPEREQIMQDGLLTYSEADLIALSPEFRESIGRLIEREDLVYVHVDLDILDPSVAPAAGLPSKGGLTGEQLGRALNWLLAQPKVGALAMVSYRAVDDVDGGTLQQVKQALLMATAGLSQPTSSLVDSRENRDRRIGQ
jgi:arginase